MGWAALVRVRAGRVWVWVVGKAGVVGEAGEAAAERGGGREVTHTLFFLSLVVFRLFLLPRRLPLLRHRLLFSSTETLRP